MNTLAKKDIGHEASVSTANAGRFRRTLHAARAVFAAGLGFLATDNAVAQNPAGANVLQSPFAHSLSVPRGQKDSRSFTNEAAKIIVRMNLIDRRTPCPTNAPAAPVVPPSAAMPKQTTIPTPAPVMPVAPAPKQTNAPAATVPTSAPQRTNAPANIVVTAPAPVERAHMVREDAWIRTETVVPGFGTVKGPGITIEGFNVKATGAQDVRNLANASAEHEAFVAESLSRHFELALRRPVKLTINDTRITVHEIITCAGQRTMRTNICETPQTTSPWCHKK